MIKNYFSANLKHIIDKENLSQSDFGDIIGKGRSVVGSYIRGESKPDLDIIIKIADNFGYTLNELISENLQVANYSDHVIKETEVSEENDTYDKIGKIVEILSVDKNLSLKLDKVLQNQEAILDKLDRGILKDILDDELKSLEANKKKSN
jgi:transcriptional regulator with XRE-family HTH domain